MAKVKWTFTRELPHYRAVILDCPEKSKETVTFEVPDDLDDDLARAYVAAGEDTRPAAITIGGLRAEVRCPTLGEHDDAERVAAKFRDELDQFVVEMKTGSEALHEAFLALDLEALVWRTDPQEPDYHLRFADPYPRIYENCREAAENLAAAIIDPERVKLNWASWGSSSNLPAIGERIQEVDEYVREERSVILKAAEWQHKQRAMEIQAREKENGERFQELLYEQLNKDLTKKARWERGLMSEEEERNLVRDNLFAMTRDWPRYRKLNASDVCDECETARFFAKKAEVLTDAQFEELLAAEAVFPGDEWTVEARIHEGVCECSDTVIRYSILVTWDIGPGAPKLSREFALD